MLFLILACSPYDPATGTPTEVATPANRIGPDGGTLREGDVELEIPPGALTEDVEIQIVDLGTDPPEGYEGLSTVWSFEPDGLVFAEPITVSIPYDDDPRPQLFWSEGDGYEPIDATFDDGMATAQIEHFSTAFVAITPVETHEEPYEPLPADLLVVVDNSCSMFDFQQRLSANVPAMLDVFTGSGLDFHIGVVSTDMNDQANGVGKLRHVGGVSYIDAQTTNPAQTFALMANMGTNGYYDEKGRAAAYTMVEIKPDIPRNAGFYRDDATLDIVFVSDEQDMSASTPVTLTEFNQWMANLKTEPAMARAHAITQLQGQLCQTAGSPGVDYVAAANASGGTVVNMCNTDWTPGLLQMVEDRLAGGEIQLPVVPSELVSVRFDGDSDLDLEPDEYTLTGDTLRFDQGVVPFVGESVVVRYRP